MSAKSKKMKIPPEGGTTYLLVIIGINRQYSGRIVSLEGQRALRTAGVAGVRITFISSAAYHFSSSFPISHRNRSRSRSRHFHAIHSASSVAHAQSASRPAPDSQQGALRNWIDPDQEPIRKNFDSQAAFSPDGRTVIVSGRIGACEPGERTAEIQVSLLQPSTLASLNAKEQLPCPAGEDLDFVIQATVPEGKPAFDEGVVQACGLAISRSGRNVQDIEYWCTFIGLRKE